MKILSKISLTLLICTIHLAVPVYALEGRIEISSPTSITASGSYILVNDIVAQNGSAIRIRSSNVTLDLNGFAITYTGVSTADGISVSASANNIEITDGTITGFSRHGLFVPGLSTSARNIKINNLRVSDNRIIGISLESNPGFIVESCTISGNAVGIYANGFGLVSNNVIALNNSSGLTSYSNGVLGFRSNVFYGNGKDVNGSATNLGENLCSGALC